MLNTRSKGTLALDVYLEELRTVDKRCYNNISEKLLKFHSDIELHQRSHLDNVIKYNNVIYNLQEMVYKNIDKDESNLSMALDLFIADAVEHKNTILELYNDGIHYKNRKFRNKVGYSIIRKCLDDMITEIENNLPKHYVEVSPIRAGNYSFEIEKNITVENGETIVNFTKITI